MLNEEKLARRAPSGSRQRAIDVLYARGEHRFRMQLGALGRVLQLLGRPERRFPSILIGGTNGKGSVSAICDSIARAAGRRTGFYSSPHLVSVGERVRIEGRAADDDQLSGWLEVVLEAEEQVCRRVADSELSYFELLTAAAFVAFAEREVELAVLEVGLGGRLDATNAAAPVVSVLTNVGLDHEAVLGGTLEAIAREKAGILRPGTPLVTGITERLFQSTVAPLCTRLDVPTSRLGVDFDVEYRVEGDAVARFVDAEYSLARLALCGRVQHQNAALAIAAVRQIGIGQRETIEAGLAAVRWPGRFEWLPGHPRPVLVDVAHNPDGARALANFLDESAPSRWHAVFAVQQGKKWESMLELVAPRCAELVFCPLPHPGGLDPLAAHDWARRAGHASSVADSASAAYNRARLGAGSAADASILIFGSHYLVGPLRHALTSEVASR